MCEHKQETVPFKCIQCGTRYTMGINSMFCTKLCVNTYVDALDKYYHGQDSDSSGS